MQFYTRTTDNKYSDSDRNFHMAAAVTRYYILYMYIKYYSVSSWHRNNRDM